MDSLHRGDLGEEGQAVAHGVVAFIKGLAVVVLDKRERLSFFEFLKIGGEPFGCDEKGADVLFFEGLLSLGEGHFL